MRNSVEWRWICLYLLYIYIYISYHIEMYMLARVQVPEIVIEFLENLPALTVRSRPSYTHRLTTKKSHWQIKMVWKKKCINQLCCWQLIFVYYTVVYTYYADFFLKCCIGWCCIYRIYYVFFSLDTPPCSSYIYNIFLHPNWWSSLGGMLGPWNLTISFRSSIECPTRLVTSESCYILILMLWYVGWNIFLKMN